MWMMVCGSNFHGHFRNLVAKIIEQQVFYRNDLVIGDQLIANRALCQFKYVLCLPPYYLSMSP